MLLHYYEFDTLKNTWGLPDVLSTPEPEFAGYHPSRFRDRAECVPVSLIYTKSREYTATNKGDTTRRKYYVYVHRIATSLGSRPEFRF